MVTKKSTKMFSMHGSGSVASHTRCARTLQRFRWPPRHLHPPWRSASSLAERISPQQAVDLDGLLVHHEQPAPRQSRKECRAADFNSSSCPKSPGLLVQSSPRAWGECTLSEEQPVCQLPLDAQTAAPRHAQSVHPRRSSKRRTCSETAAPSDPVPGRNVRRAQAPD